MHMRRGHRCGVRVHLDHIVSSESYCRALPTLDLQKANGKLGVTAWRCETLSDSPAGVDVRAGRKRGTFCSHAAGLRMRQQLR